MKKCNSNFLKIIVNKGKLKIEVVKIHEKMKQHDLREKNEQMILLLFAKVVIMKEKSRGEEHI